MVGALAAFVREDLAVKQVTLDDRSRPPAIRSRCIDAAQIRQCLINLVRNAAEAVVAKGGGHVTLRTRVAGDRDRDRCRGQRDRHRGRRAAAAVRPVLLDQGGRQRPRPRADPADRSGSRRRSARRQRGRTRYDLHGQRAGRRIAIRARASAHVRGRPRAPTGSDIAISEAAYDHTCSVDDRRRETARRSRAGHAVRRVRGRGRSGRRLHREPVFGRHVRRDEPRAAGRHAGPARALVPRPARADLRSTAPCAGRAAATAWTATAAPASSSRPARPRSLAPIIDRIRQRDPQDRCRGCSSVLVVEDNQHVAAADPGGPHAARRAATSAAASRSCSATPRTAAPRSRSSAASRSTR